MPVFGGVYPQDVFLRAQPRLIKILGHRNALPQQLLPYQGVLGNGEAVPGGQVEGVVVGGGEAGQGEVNGFI